MKISPSLQAAVLLALVYATCVADQLVAQSPGAASGATRSELEPEAVQDEPARGIAADPGMLEFDDGGVETLQPIEPTPRLNQLSLKDVIASVYQSFPTIVQARQQATLARGALTEAHGAYDTKLKWESLNEPTGFYENYRHGIGASQQTWNGGNWSGGYRIGRGDFQPWYLERETDKGGELKLGYRHPLMQGRDIDAQRVAVYQASLALKATQPSLQLAALEIARDATILYWGWVEAGNILESQKSLVDLATERGEQYESGVDAGKFAEIDLILNQQLIAERRANLLESTQKFQAIAFKLSIFLRDSQGIPVVPDSSLLPDQFPAIVLPERMDIAEAVSVALALRPELRALELQRQKLQYDLALARNQTQARLDVIAEGSKDFGEDTSSSDDKDQLLILLGIQGELPIQRRKARGKQAAVTAKLAQLEQKGRLIQDKLRADLQIGLNELQLDAQVVAQAKVAVKAARETLRRYRFAFEKGKIDLIYLNLLEVKVNESEIKLLNANKQWYAAAARLDATLGYPPSRRY